MKRKEHEAWPRVLVPEQGFFPPVPTEQVSLERIFHVALKTSDECQPGLDAALRSISSAYASFDWIAMEKRADFVAQLLDAAREIEPTLVFMQLQRQTPLCPEVIAMLRAEFPNVVIINWDGDQHYEPNDARRAWFVELGRVCDASLVVNTKHPFQYYELGVRRPGYLQIGIDDRFRRRFDVDDGFDLVFLANAYPSYDAYARRREIVTVLEEKIGRRFAVFGHGWPNACRQPWLRQESESVVYGSARAALSMSIRSDLPRYTSDRLFRALASGAVVLVEAFPDCEGLGLVDGENCFLWRTVEELLSRVNDVARMNDVVHTRMRCEAAQLSRLHTWQARMPELAAIVQTVRTGHVR